MSAATPVRARHLPVGPAMLMLVSVLGVAVVFWGFFFGREVEVEYFDAGTVDRFAIHDVVAYPERDLYIVGLTDGRIRALDGRVQQSGCTVNWLPDDPRGAVRNPQGLPGVYEDPCTGALWSFEGNAISGTEHPLRTPHLQPRRDADGTSHIVVELVNPSR